MEVNYLQAYLDDCVGSALLGKANNIYRNYDIRLLQTEEDEDEATYEFKCQAQSDKSLYYHVEIKQDDEGEVATFCTCPQHEVEDNCKHAVACILYLLNIKPKAEETEAVMPGSAENNILGDSAQIYGLGYLNEWQIFRSLSAQKKKQIIEEVTKKNVVTILSESEKKSLVATVQDKKVICTVWLQRSAGAILAACTCGVPLSPCIHTRNVLYYLLKSKKNSCYLDTLRNTDAEKNALLATVGLNLEDEQANLFEFYFEEKTLRMKGRGNLIMKANDWKSGNYLQKTLAEKRKQRITPPAPQADEHIVILRIHKDTPVVRWEVYGITGSADNVIAINKKLSDFDTGILRGIAGWLSDFIYHFTPAGVLAQLSTKGLLSSYYYNAINELNNLSADKYAVVKNSLITAFKKNIGKLSASNQFFSTGLKTTKPKPAELQPLSFSTNYFTLHLQVKPNGKFVFITAMVKIDNEILPLTDFENYGQIMLVKAGTAYIADTETTWRLLQDFNTQAEIIMPLSEAGNLYKEYLLPLRKEVSMELPEAIMPVTVAPVLTTMAVRLKEMEPNFLILQPIVKYDGAEAELDGEDIETFINGQLQIIDRDEAKEAFLLNLVSSLHPGFAEQENTSYFYITFTKALAGGWFFDAIKTLATNNIEIYGQKQLTKFKYNTNKPKLEIKGGSGIDWFDLKIEVSYGDQLVPLKALKQAILNKQDFVQLGDGTLGLLPEEWLKKFRSLFQLGNIGVAGELKVSKFHYTLIDELHGAITDDSILAELALKKQQLNQLQYVQEIAVPKNIKATLRPYQLAGLNWFNQLHQIGWGGCLADDMGLGKTLQTLCYLQHLYNQNKKLRALIVCPTSLIYNWQAELDKFTAGISYVIYHGGDRAFPEIKGKWNLVITSYGTMRNDIEKFSQLPFDVTVLDESQSIKNPTSLVTKAVALIQTKMRFILSGTPVQNNTYDLYAQLNFCNPGLLGNQEFFKAEFATLIDKYGDREKSEQLRKMVFPFILRRTKEQVAKDLPDKTETILYCEMGSYQQKVYDSVKEEYRLKILSKIEEQGLGKTAFVILEGLNKLRMICDCPSLIKDEEKKRFKQESIKVNEMMREIEENIGNHKMLIFSQFLGMLELIKDKLDADGIKYIYLDGSTPAKERGRLVEQFQTDAGIQIFLISLKAGGVGLNLTAADYVYVLDPWWNPAVEDQAIDRTHRIGQHKKIFAYKLICKNTIEEKILQLQAKKKSLAKELITEDASFIKKLTKEDVEWLLN